MGLSLMTALEIFNHPNDLCIWIAGSDAKKYAFAISRGAEHNGKMLLSTEPYFKTKDEVIKTIHETLKAIFDACIKELSDPDSFTAIILNQDNAPQEEWVVLNQNRIDEITKALKQKMAWP